MKAEYTIIYATMKGDNVIEVMNDYSNNTVTNLGWVFLKTAYIAKDHRSVGVWRPKQLKN